MASKLLLPGENEMKNIYLLMILLFVSILTGCSGGSSNPTEPSKPDYVSDTLNRAADALERGNVDECVKYFYNPEKNKNALLRLRNQWKMLAKAIREGVIDESDLDQIKLRIRLDRPDKPGEFIESKIYLVKTDDGKWLLSPIAVKRKKPSDRQAAWGTNTVHGTYLTRGIVEYYIRNYPDDYLFTGPTGFLNPNQFKFNVVGTHPGPIETVLGFDIDNYETAPPDAYIVLNAPTAVMQIGAMDEDTFVGEYDSGMNLTFNRDIWFDFSNGFTIRTSNNFADGDDTSFKGYAHFLTPLNQDYIQNSFIGFNDLGLLGNQDAESAPAHKWGLGMEKIGPVNIIDVVDMRENWNRKTWQYAVDQYKQAFQTTDPLLRGKRLCDSFYAFGHVLHLLEDCGIPAHVRNDMHGVPALSYIPGFDYLAPDPLEDWSDSFNGNLINKTVYAWTDLYREMNPIIRYPGGFSVSEPLLYYYYNNTELPQYAGYEAIFKSLAFMTNRTFVSEDTIHRSTQSYANTTNYPEITSWSFDYGGRTVINGKSGLPFDNKEYPLAVSTLWFDTWCTGFWALHWRWPTMEEVVAELPGDDGLFTTEDDWDDDYFTNGNKGVRETAYEVQFKRTVRHGAALLHEFYLACTK
jgi:hypothetical protein